ncbi:unnamed protein product [Cyprideis torosa]|uniref:Uncharacterized protein n=1 Tax=Cyprideis torosa TaxID=163714 RepID=A0A7R8ZP58_9CRUS|nr:unnamed protein product [Cyprideis torosa]CAG0899703.1 unnamed protein product [Cyprideis torosa]
MVMDSVVVWNPSFKHFQIWIPKNLQLKDPLDSRALSALYRKHRPLYDELVQRTSGEKISDLRRKNLQRDNYMRLRGTKNSSEPLDWKHCLLDSLKNCENIQRQLQDERLRIMAMHEEATAEAEKLMNLKNELLRESLEIEAISATHKEVDRHSSALQTLRKSLNQGKTRLVGQGPPEKQTDVRARLTDKKKADLRSMLEMFQKKAVSKTWKGLSTLTLEALMKPNPLVQASTKKLRDRFDDLMNMKDCLAHVLFFTEEYQLLLHKFDRNGAKFSCKAPAMYPGERDSLEAVGHEELPDDIIQHFLMENEMYKLPTSDMAGEFPLDIDLRMRIVENESDHALEQGGGGWLKSIHQQDEYMRDVILQPFYFEPIARGQRFRELADMERNQIHAQIRDKFLNAAEDGPDRKLREEALDILETKIRAEAKKERIARMEVSIAHMEKLTAQRAEEKKRVKAVLLPRRNFHSTLLAVRSKLNPDPSHFDRCKEVLQEVKDLAAQFKQELANLSLVYTGTELIDCITGTNWASFISIPVSPWLNGDLDELRKKAEATVESLWESVKLKKELDQIVDGWKQKAETIETFLTSLDLPPRVAKGLQVYKEFLKAAAEKAHV